MREMSYPEAEELLRSHGVPVVKSCYMTKKTQSAQKSAEVGFPLVMKVDASQPIHKSDKGYVKTGVDSVEEIEEVFEEMKENAEKEEIGFQGVVIQKQLTGREVIVGGKRDPQFGPVVLFGQGGVFVEILEDTSIRVAPIDQEEAIRMIKEIETYEMFTGARGQEPVNVEKIGEIISKTSDLMVKNPEIQEMDLNPIIANSEGAKAVDLRILKKEEVSK